MSLLDKIINKTNRKYRFKQIEKNPVYDLDGRLLGFDVVVLNTETGVRIYGFQKVIDLTKREMIKMKEIKLKEVKFEWTDGKLYAREMHEDGKEVLVHIKGSPTDYIKKLALEDGITQEDFDRAHVTYKEEERGEEYELPTTIEGLEELKKKVQGHKKSYETGIVASDFVIGVCDMKIHKLEREGKQQC